MVILRQMPNKKENSIKFTERPVLSSFDKTAAKQDPLESEKIYKKLVESSLTGVFIQQHGKFIYVNNEFAKIHGYKPFELIGENYLKLVCPQDRKAVSRICYARLRGISEPQRYEIRRLKKDGTVIYCSMMVSRFRYRNKPAIMGNVVDVTARKKAEDALRESEKFNSILLENTPNPIIVHDPDTTIKYVNRAVVELLGFSAKELVGVKAPHPWWTEQTKCKTRKDLLKILHKKLVREEEVFRNKNGQRLYVEINSRPIRIKNRFKFLLSNWVDITERKKTEEQLIKLNEELRSLSAHLESARENERTRIAREIHDELGQALASLKMDVSWLSKNLTRDQDSLRELTRSMSKLIDVTVQKVKQLCIELRPKLLDDIGLVGTIEWLSQEFQNVTGIKCKVRCNIDESIVVNERATTIFRIFQEALTNVYRHAQASEVNVSLRRNDYHILFKVSDNGKGITAEQISSPKSFGLIGMRERLRVLGGEVKISGLPGKGTQLSIRLPLN